MIKDRMQVKIAQPLNFPEGLSWLYKISDSVADLILRKFYLS